MRATQRFFHRVDHPLPLAMAIAALLGTGAATCADAAVTHPVTSCDDSGPGTLRAVVAAAGNGDIVDFSALQCQQSTISLQSGIVVAQNDLTIVGNPDVVLIGKYDRVLDHTGAGTLTVAEVTIGGGSVTGSDVRGGCIASAGKAVVYESRIDNCQAHATSGFAYGGAVYGRDGITVKYSQVSGSRVSADAGYASGGAIGAGGSVVLRYSTIAGNESIGTPGRGGGVFVIGNTAIDHSTIEGNRANSLAGGLLQAGSGVASGLTMRSSTISGNEALYVGGAQIQNTPNVRIANSTIAFNHATQGSAVAAGLHLNASPTSIMLTLQSTIVSNNFSPSGDLDLTQSANSGAAITLDDTSAANLVRIPGAGALPADTLSGQCPLLRPLRNNGGWTATHALASRSIAIDHGTNPLDDKQDQRGTAGDAALYPRVSNGVADIGAFEVNQADTVFAAGFEGCAQID